LKIRILIIIAMLSYVHSAHANVIDGSKYYPDQSLAKERVLSLSDQLTLPYTDETRRLIDVYTRTYLPGAKRIIKRSQNYYPLYDHLLKERGLPSVLKNIGIVESNLDPWTFSSRGAVGVWQLMKSTARAQGLTVDKYVDERFDPVKAGTVAFNYLAELHDEFQDWNLTLVAYNFGPSALRKAIKYCGSNEYEIIKEVLPKESVKYASRLAAASYLSEYYSEHRKLESLTTPEMKLASMPIHSYISFDEIAQVTSLSIEEITEYNPAINFDYIPTNDKGYVLNLPLDKMIQLSSLKGWSMTDVYNFDFHRDQIEELLAFHLKINDDHSQPYESDNPDHSFEDLALDGLRREQILTLQKLG